MQYPTQVFRSISSPSLIVLYFLPTTEPDGYNYHIAVSPDGVGFYEVAVIGPDDIPVDNMTLFHGFLGGSPAMLKDPRTGSTFMMLRGGGVIIYGRDLYRYDPGISADFNLDAIVPLPYLRYSVHLLQAADGTFYYLCRNSWTHGERDYQLYIGPGEGATQVHGVVVLQPSGSKTLVAKSPLGQLMMHIEARRVGPRSQDVEYVFSGLYWKPGKVSDFSNAARSRVVPLTLLDLVQYSIEDVDSETVTITKRK